MSRASCTLPVSLAVEALHEKNTPALVECGGRRTGMRVGQSKKARSNNFRDPDTAQGLPGFQVGSGQYHGPGTRVVGDGGAGETRQRDAATAVFHFSSGVRPINPQIAVLCESGKVAHLHGHLPVFQYDQQDLASFRLFTSQMIVNGSVRHGEVARAFAVPLSTVKRYAKLYREKGASGFLTPRRRRPAAVLTDEVKAQGPRRCWRKAGAPRKPDRSWPSCRTRHARRSRQTICTCPVNKRLCTEDVRCSSKGERSQIESQAEMGNGAKCTLQRVISAGDIDAPGAVRGGAGYAATIDNGKFHGCTGCGKTP